KLEEKIGIDLNGDGRIGGPGYTAKLEQATHVDLNRDGIIGGYRAPPGGEKKLIPILPSKLPVQPAVILKYIDNNILHDEVKMDIEEKRKSVYSIEEMLGTQSYRPRHIRVDLLSKEEYETILNCGKISLSGQLYNVDEFLPSPKLLIWSKCNSPGHMQKILDVQSKYVEDVVKIK
ncbi:unnamed protein product, partial [Didymodactylos carnosus]